MLSTIDIYRKEENIYFDVELSNPLEGEDNAIAQFDQNYNQTILKHPDKYKLTVARLFVPGSEIPLFIGNSTTFSVTLEYDGNFYQTFLPFTDNVGVRTVSRTLNTLNEALQTSFEALKLVSAAAPGDYAPFFKFDNATKQLAIFVDNKYNQLITGIGTEVIKIWLNSPLLHLLGCIHFDTVNIPELSDGRGGLVSVPDLGYNRTTYQYPLDSVGVLNPIGTNTPSLELPQTQGNCLSTMSKLSGFIITSNSFGHRPQYQNRQSIITSANFENANYVEKPVVFDLTVDNSGSSLTETFTYTPSLYRWIDVLSHNEINRIQFQVFFKFTTGETLPLTLGLGRSMGIKFLLSTADSIEKMKGQRAVDSNLQF